MPVKYLTTYIFIQYTYLYPYSRLLSFIFKCFLVSFKLLVGGSLFLILKLVGFSEIFLPQSPDPPLLTENTLTAQYGPVYINKWRNLHMAY